MSTKEHLIELLQRQEIAAVDFVKSIDKIFKDYHRSIASISGTLTDNSQPVNPFYQDKLGADFSTLKFSISMKKMDERTKRVLDPDYSNNIEFTWDEQNEMIEEMEKMNIIEKEAYFKQLLIEANYQL